MESSGLLGNVAIYAKPAIDQDVTGWNGCARSGCGPVRAEREIARPPQDSRTRRGNRRDARLVRFPTGLLADQLAKFATGQARVFPFGTANEHE